MSMEANTSYWQSELDCEVQKHIDDHLFLSHVIQALQAKAEAIQAILENPSAFKKELEHDLRAQRLVSQMPL